MQLRFSDKYILMDFKRH